MLNVVSSSITGNGDNDGDGAQIAAGRRTSSNCDTAAASPASRNAGGGTEQSGVGTGWQQGGTVSPALGCYGKCGGGGGKVWVGPTLPH